MSLNNQFVWSFEENILNKFEELQEDGRFDDIAAESLNSTTIPVPPMRTWHSCSMNLAMILQSPAPIFSSQILFLDIAIKASAADTKRLGQSMIKATSKNWQTSFSQKLSYALASQPLKVFSLPLLQSFPAPSRTTTHLSKARTIRFPLP